MVAQRVEMISFNFFALVFSREISSLFHSISVCKNARNCILILIPTISWQKDIFYNFILTICWFLIPIISRYVLWSLESHNGICYKIQCKELKSALSETISPKIIVTPTIVASKCLIVLDHSGTNDKFAACTVIFLRVTLYVRRTC